MKRIASKVLAAATLLLAMPTAVFADLLGDWGVIPLGSETTFVFSPSDAGTNFTDQYTFSLSGTTDITFSTASFLAACTKGCGSPSLSFGIYDANGSLLDASGTVTLGAGNYVFQIKGTGMGSGNTAGTGGTITFMSEAAPADIVSPAPEPQAWLVLLPGAALVGWVMHHRAKSKGPDHDA